MKRPPLSLKGQALALLARREHSRTELRSKLLGHARKRALWAAAEQGESPGLAAETFDAEQVRAEVEALLDSLEAARHLSDARFAESRVHARAARQGTARIRQELSRHGVELDADTARQLRDTELARAREVWRRKFGGEAPADAPARAKQMRFLAARGFAAEVIRRLVGGRDDDA